MAEKYAMGDTQSALFAKAPVLANPSTEGFFGIFPQYAAFAKEADRHIRIYLSRI